MGKHARKRQRTGKPQNEEVQPLGSVISVLDDSSKDDEERRLESMLFGTQYVPSKRSEKNVLAVSDEEDEDLQIDVGGRELGHLLDTDLFFVDDAAPSALEPPVPDGAEEDEETSEAFSAGSSSEDESSSEGQEEDGGAPSEAQPPTPEQTAFHKSRKAPAWTDPDDQQIQVSLASDKRLRKLRDAPSEDLVGGREYERRLRRQFEKINPTPEWAIKARRKAKRRRTSVSGDESENEVVEDLLTSTNGILSAGKKSRGLPQGTLAIERLRDANITAKAEGEVKTVQFHPSPRIPIMLTASTDRRLRLFNIDGHSNPHLQTLHIPSLPLTNALFHPDGTSVLLTGPRPFYYTYDLQSGASRRSPRGLWGTTFANNNPLAQDASMETCAFSPSGEVLAVGGRRGYVHLVDWQSGAGQVVGSVKMNAGVKSVWWARGGEARELMTLSEDSEVYIWDVGQRRCIKRWKEDGGFGSRVMVGDNKGQYLAIGSNTGFVNVYSPALSTSDKPLKTIGNLTTSISSLQFSHDSQILAMASNSKKDQMRLIHLPSLTAFSNWPTSSTPLGHVTAMDFSRGNEYVAVGNNRGRVLLYQLRNYINQ
ncbi:WD40 repeat-like protein [Neolentinus lepideus HHB14362 ss-1]|uniref:WD40 repeat-like protein n=1 Tax=Neolentinus lepideus HHB14362 ss-1 TaxID=1314782 RepID=A0A165RX38_9AGAM|nr:WD40 repeat-like protein [Neolentinus lepideus HHB14362 ss-1]